MEFRGHKEKAYVPVQPKAYRDTIFSLNKSRFTGISVYHCTSKKWLPLCVNESPKLLCGRGSDGRRRKINPIVWERKGFFRASLYVLFLLNGLYVMTW